MKSRPGEGFPRLLSGSSLPYKSLFSIRVSPHRFAWRSEGGKIESMQKQSSSCCLGVFGLILAVAAGSWSDDGTGSICGKVLKPNGKPAKKAQVDLHVDYWKSPRLIASADTDAQGAFCLHGIVPGEYTIFTSSPTHAYSSLCDLKEIVLFADLEVELELKKDVCMMTGIPTYLEYKSPPMSKVWKVEDLQNLPTGSVGGR